MRPRFYVPATLRNFQGFSVRDIKEFSKDERVEVHYPLEMWVSELQIPRICTSRDLELPLK